jgi:hypothetical protein
MSSLQRPIRICRQILVKIQSMYINEDPSGGSHTVASRRTTHTTRLVAVCQHFCETAQSPRRPARHDDKREKWSTLTATLILNPDTRRRWVVRYTPRPGRFNASESCWLVECDWNVMAQEQTRFRLSEKRTSPFESAGMSVQSAASRWSVHIVSLLVNAGPAVICISLFISWVPTPFAVSP